MEMPPTPAGTVLSGKAQAWLLLLPLATFGVSPPAPWPSRGVLRMRGAVWHPRVPGPCDKSLPWHGGERGPPAQCLRGFGRCTGARRQNEGLWGDGGQLPRRTKAPASASSSRCLCLRINSLQAVSLALPPGLEPLGEERSPEQPAWLERCPTGLCRRWHAAPARSALPGLRPKPAAPVAWPRVPRVGVPALRGPVGAQECACAPGGSSDAWVGLLVVCPSAEVLVVRVCIPRCTGVYYAQACARIHVHHLCRGCMLFKCVCTSVHPPLQKVCCVHVCARTHVPLSAKGVCRAHTCILLSRRCMPCTRVCTHTHPPLQKVYIVHMCVCTRIPLYRRCMSCTHVYMHTHASPFAESVFHAHMCAHTCVPSAEGVLCAHMHSALQNPCAHQGCPGERTHMCPWLPPAPAHPQVQGGGPVCPPPLQGRFYLSTARRSLAALPSLTFTY